LASYERILLLLLCSDLFRKADLREQLMNEKEWFGNVQPEPSAFGRYRAGRLKQ
jgi:hypothetical protein